jgi:hypothetical protein
VFCFVHSEIFTQKARNEGNPSTCFIYDATKQFVMEFGVCGSTINAVEGISFYFVQIQRDMF